MNSVSWFIYIAQVSENMGRLLIFLGIIGTATSLLFFIVPRAIKFIEAGDDISVKPFKASVFALGVVALLLGNLMPERNTMYAIAASQVGEQIVKTEIASDATKALHQWIKKQIEPQK